MPALPGLPLRQAAGSEAAANSEDAADHRRIANAQAGALLGEWPGVGGSPRGNRRFPPRVKSNGRDPGRHAGRGHLIRRAALARRLRRFRAPKKRGPNLSVSRAAARASRSRSVLLPSRQIASVSASPGFLRSITVRSCCSLQTGVWSAATMMSPPSRYDSPATTTGVEPERRPAFAALLPGTTAWISRPRIAGRLKVRARSPVTGTAPAPRNACSTLPFRISCATTVLTVLIGIAKPIPTFPSVPEPPVRIWELTPITSPRALISGPPELPWLIAASVWIAWSIVEALFGASIVR